MRAFEKILIHARRAGMKTDTLPGNEDAETIDVSNGGDFKAILLDGCHQKNEDSLLLFQDATGVEIRLKGPWGSAPVEGIKELKRLIIALNNTLWEIEHGEQKIARMVDCVLRGEG